MQYRVVMPMLACSGDYSPIYALIATNKDRTIGEDEPSHALNIAAGYCYYIFFPKGLRFENRILNMWYGSTLNVMLVFPNFNMFFLSCLFGFLICWAFSFNIWLLLEILMMFRFVTVGTIPTIDLNICGCPHAHEAQICRFWGHWDQWVQI